MRKKLKKAIITILIIILALLIWLILALYISTKTNKPCIYVEPDCEELCKTTEDPYQCAVCQPYTYCWREALIDKIQYFKIFWK